MGELPLNFPISAISARVSFLDKGGASRRGFCAEVYGPEPKSATKPKRLLRAHPRRSLGQDRFQKADIPQSICDGEAGPTPDLAGTHAEIVVSITSQQNKEVHEQPILLPIACSSLGFGDLLGSQL
jgi:hypothetical protein